LLAGKEISSIILIESKADFTLRNDAKSRHTEVKGSVRVTNQRNFNLRACVSDFELPFYDSEVAAML
jgi:hypothetical protein